MYTSHPTTAVLIGRNVNGTPMDDRKWDSFKAELPYLFSETFYVGAGSGTYEGRGEESYCVVGTPRHEMFELDDILVQLGRAYGQASIGRVSHCSSLGDSLVYADTFIESDEDVSEGCAVHDAKPSPRPCPAVCGGSWDQHTDVNGRGETIVWFECETCGNQSSTFWPWEVAEIVGWYDNVADIPT